jgi:hypothetical protein
MSPEVTIVIVPRDRFSSVVDCTASILKHTPEPIRLVYLDFGYDRATVEQLRKLTKDVPTEFVNCGRMIPILAFKDYLPNIKTRYTVWVDNDTYATPGWLTAMLERAAMGARVILPVTLEREGLDTDERKIPLRNHVSHTELRRVIVDGEEYVFDHKPFRRAAPEDLPQGGHTVDFFELHTFFAETEVLKQLTYPAMVVREHIDIGIQLHRMGIPIWCEPRSTVHFDNIHERPAWADLKFFFYRWSSDFVDQSHALFHERWGYRFYNEQFMRNWAFRRKVFSVCRFAGIPQKPADLVSRAFNKLFRPKLPAKLSKDPLSQSELVLRNQDAAPAAGTPVGVS